MVSHVLVAVDGSDHSDRAVDFAADFAVRYGADLTVLNVVSYASTVPLSLGAYAELEGLYAETRSILEDAGPTREFDATYEIDGVPINALELHEAAAGKKRNKIMAKIAE